MGADFRPVLATAGTTKLLPEALMAALATAHYERCTTGELEEGVEKVAIFVNRNAEYSHAARQLPDGRWTSKIGKEHDISHQLRQLEGDEYGHVAFFMRRQRQ